MLDNWTSSVGCQTNNVGRTFNFGLMMLDQQLSAMFDQKYAVGPTTLDDVVCPTVPDGVGPSILDQLVEPV